MATASSYNIKRSFMAKWRTSRATVAGDERNNNSSSELDKQLLAENGEAAAVYPAQPAPGPVTALCSIPHADSTAELHAVPVAYRPQLQLMHAQIQRLAPELAALAASEALSELAGAACVAYFPPDGAYYRATLLRAVCESFAIVQFVDFGNSCCLPARLLLRCPPQLAAEAPPRAYRCELAGCCHRQYGASAAALLADLVLDNELLVTFEAGQLGDDGQGPHAVTVACADGADLLGRLPVDRPESREFFSDEHRSLVRHGAEPDDGVDGSGGRAVGGCADHRLQYSAEELRRIGVECPPTRVAPALPPLDEACSVVALPGSRPRRLRLLPVESFCGRYVQLEDRLRYLYQELSGLARTLSAPLPAGQVCVAQLGVGQFARARVLRAAEPTGSLAVVLLLDLGIVRRLPPKLLLAMLPEVANFSPQMVVECQLLCRSVDSQSEAERLLAEADGRPLSGKFFLSAGGELLLLLLHDAAGRYIL